MSTRIDIRLLSELKAYGAVNVETCFNCGNCTAICPLADSEHPFPRNTIRMVQLGLTERLLSSPDPWLCYYCGECSDTCPKGAEPAETLMALRRWLTAQYDWTGLAKRFYTSKAWEIGSILFLAIFICLGFLFFHGPIVTSEVALNTFAPVKIIHLLDWIMAGTLGFFLVSNVFHMYYLILLKGSEIKIPFSAYVTEAWSLIVHAATQKSFSECDNRRTWIDHLITVFGYVLMFSIIVLFLNWFQTDNIYPITHPQRWLGYLATIALLYGSVMALWGRYKKTRQVHRFSHLSDWIFPILLFLTTVTGILVHIFRYTGLPMATYITYVIHLAVLGPMLILEVPFGKWAHLAYRPCAQYFIAVRKRAEQLQTAATATAGAD